MKKSIVFALLIFLGSNCFGQEKSDKQKKFPEIKFEKKVFNFGKINENKIAKHDFKFYNTGTDAIIIKYASASCDCTVPDWSKAPVMPGDSGIISATFNPKGYAGKTFRKTITVFTNVKEGKERNAVYFLDITGRVIKNE